MLKGIFLSLKRIYHHLYKSTELFISIHGKGKNKKENEEDKIESKVNIKIKSKSKIKTNDVPILSSYGVSILSEASNYSLLRNRISNNSNNNTLLLSSQKHNNFYDNTTGSQHKMIEKLLLSSKGKQNSSKHSFISKGNEIGEEIQNPFENGISAIKKDNLNSNSKIQEINEIKLDNNNTLNFNNNHNNEEEILSNFINFDFDFHDENHQNIQEEEKEDKTNIINQNNTTHNNLYNTPIKIEFTEKLFQSTLIKEKSRIHKFFTDQKINKKISKKKLDYDKQIEFPLFNNFDNKENENEEETYQKLYNKLVDLIYIKEDFENFKKSISTVQFDKNLIVNETFFNLNESSQPYINSSIRNDKLRHDNSASLENSNSIISNLSLKDVFDTTKKLINKTSNFIAYPLENGVIEEEDSNFNLNSMNTFNLKSNLNNIDFGNNLNNDDLYDIHDESKEKNEVLNIEDAVNQKIIAHKVNIPINFEKLSKQIYDNINHSISHKEQISTIFYNMLMIAQKKNIDLRQRTNFGEIIKNS